MIGVLSKTLLVDNKNYPIRTDYRDVLQIFEAFQDPELKQEEKWIVAVYLLFEDFSCAEDVFFAVENGFNIEEAIQQLCKFISAGSPEKEVLEKPTYSWQKDEQIIFSAVNKVVGTEVRNLDYLHWWTFLGYFNEIGEGTFSFIVGIRHKLNKKKKLEKYEREFLSHNKEMVRLERPKTREELEEEAENKALLDEVLG